jgi:putative membrane protein
LSLVTRHSSLFLAATLVLLLDLQIETVATRINQYWIWREGGPYYGVPTANFVAWWLIGLAMALIMAMLLPRAGDEQISRPGDKNTRRQKATHLMSHISCLASRITRWLPAALYLLSTLMFSIVNIARGYTVAGLVGVLVLLVAVARAAWPAGAQAALFADPAEPAE